MLISQDLPILVSGILSECPEFEVANIEKSSYLSRLTFQRIEGWQSMSPCHSFFVFKSTGNNYASSSCNCKYGGQCQALSKGGP
jgi:hypothetical protein